MSKVNLKELAQVLNVSISTVSKALRGSYEIGEATKQKVVAKANELGYTPNPYAGFLRNHKSKNVALIVPELNNNFFIQAISGAESITKQKDYHLLIYCTNDDVEQESKIIQHLTNGRVDGVIISVSSSTTNYSQFAKLQESGIPIIFFDRIIHEIETAKITTDDFVSSFNATEHLIKNGSRKIAYLSIAKNLSIDLKRKQGYLEALNKYNLVAKADWIVQCSNDEKNNIKKIKQLLQSNNKPDAIFASVEKLALTTYLIAKESSIQIPKQLKLICFSNLQTAPYLNPSLSTIQQPAYDMGEQAAQILFKYLDKKRNTIPNEHIILKSTLIIRDSSKK